MRGSKRLYNTSPFKIKYDETVMVAMPTAAIKETSSLDTWPKTRPEARRIKENSEICAPVIATRKDVRLRKPKESITAKTIRGLAIKTNSVSQITSDNKTWLSPADNDAPSIIKKRIVKKSRRGFTLAEIWILYCDD